LSEGTEKIVFSGTIDAQGRLHADEVNATAGRLAKWKGRHVTVSVSRYVKSKTNPQLGLYFRDGGIVHAWSDYTGYDRDEMHIELKRAFLAPQLAVSRLTGEERQELPSLADLNVEEMSAYMERVLREGRQRGIVFDLDESSADA
jgi:hypothetical protein